MSYIANVINYSFIEVVMLLAHIAFSLELISLAVGSILVLKCCMSCCPSHKENLRSDTSENPRKSHRHFGFLKFIGYLIIILSFLGLLCTAIASVCHLTKYGFADVVYPDYKSRNLDRTEPRLEPNHKMVPPIPGSENP
jgi:hypothetical protein